MKKLKDLLLDNLLLKGISILLAVLLWHQVSQQQAVLQIVSIPLGFKLPDGLIISNDPANQIEVYARSQRSSGVDQTQLSAVIDLPNATPGTQVIQLTQQNINRPAHVEIDSILPSMIRLEIEQVVSKAVRVEPKILGEPAQRFEVTGIRVVPAEIWVSGPASQVSQTSAIQTIPINIEGRQAPTTQNAFVDLEDLDLRVDDDLSLLVNIMIEEKRRDIQIQNVAVTITPAEVSVRLDTERLNLMGSVPLSWTGDLDPKLFLVEVDLSNETPSARFSEFDPQITVPPEYTKIFRLTGYLPLKIKARRLR